ncbi:MAG: type I-C CRISPR-associated protein Cas8c/Csd1 [Verrucomicrobiales bacterium]
MLAKNAVSASVTPPLSFGPQEPTPAEALFPQMMSDVLDAEDDATKQRIGDILEKISRGTLGYDELGTPETDFYILGLSPNASRLLRPLLAHGNPAGSHRQSQTPPQPTRNRPPMGRIQLKESRTSPPK